MASRLVVVTSHPFRTLDAPVLCFVPADVGLLDDVFGVGTRAEHAVGETEEPAAQRLEGGYRRSSLGHTLFSDPKTDDARTL